MVFIDIRFVGFELNFKKIFAPVSNNTPVESVLTYGEFMNRFITFCWDMCQKLNSFSYYYSLLGGKNSKLSCNRINRNCSSLPKEKGKLNGGASILGYAINLLCLALRLQDPHYILLNSIILIT